MRYKDLKIKNNLDKLNKKQDEALMKKHEKDKRIINLIEKNNLNNSKNY